MFTQPSLHIMDVALGRLRSPHTVQRYRRCIDDCPQTFYTCHAYAVLSVDLLASCPVTQSMEGSIRFGAVNFKWWGRQINFRVYRNMVCLVPSGRVERKHHTKGWPMPGSTCSNTHITLYHHQLSR
jgi:hypothetical protein